MRALAWLQNASLAPVLASQPQTSMRARGEERGTRRSEEQEGSSEPRQGTRHHTAALGSAVHAPCCCVALLLRGTGSVGDSVGEGLHYRLLTLCPASTDPMPRGQLWPIGSVYVCMYIE